MNLLKDPWIPVRADGGTGAFCLLTYQQLLCEPGNWQVSLPRDDLEMACVQLLVCMTQVMFMPEGNPANDPNGNKALRARITKLLSPDEFAAGIKPCHDWFDLDHPTQPFMQSRGVKAEKVTPIQKILVGLPEGNNHAFFNEVGEVRKLSGALTAIALFNQASNANSMGGGFKGNLRGGSNPYLTPVNIFVAGADLRETVWHNMLTLPRIKRLLPGWEPDFGHDQPTWIKPIKANELIQWNDIGLARGLFWQPTRLELVREKATFPCDVLEGNPTQVYTSFLKEQFKFTVNGLWPHPHGARTAALKNGVLKWKFASFSITNPAWTQLSEFVVPRGTNDSDAREGSEPSAPVAQADELGEGRLHLWVGGYCAKQGSIVGRRHEMISLAKGWRDEKGHLPELVAIGMGARDSLLDAIFTVAFGQGELKGVGLVHKKKGRRTIRNRKDANGFHDISEKSFYARTESLIHETFSDELTWPTARSAFAKQLADHCRDIFEELTDPYAMKPELIPIIAWARRSLNTDLKKLMEEA